MVMHALRKGALGGTLKFILFSLLLLAMGGLVFTDVGGFFRDGGVQKTDVAKIGDETISAQNFDRTVRRNLQKLGMSPHQAYQMGYLREMLRAEIRTRLLAQNAHDLGIHVSTAQVAQNLQKLLKPMLKPDQSPQDLLKQILAAQGMSEQELTRSLQDEISNALVGGTIKSGFAALPDDLVNDLALFEKEERAVEYIAFPDKDFTGLKDPTDKDLKPLYETGKEAFAKPELRTAQIITLKKDGVKNTLSLPDTELKDTYERNIAQYQQPETRSIEQAVLPKAETAQKIVDALHAGKSLAEALKTVTGNANDLLPEKSVEKDDLDEALKNPVFAAKQGDIIGPVHTALGEQIVIVKTITQAGTQSFESVKEAIRKELTETKTLDAQYAMAGTLDDMLASGANIDDIKAQVDIDVLALPPVDRSGLGADGKPALEGIPALKDDSSKILKGLYELSEEESSPVFELKNGQMIAITLTSLTPKSYASFDSVKDVLKKRWLADNRKMQNRFGVLKTLAALQGDNASLKDAAQKYKKQVQNISGLVRASKPKAPLLPQSVMAIFEAPENELFVLDLEDGAAIAHVTSLKADKVYSKEEREKVLPNILQSFENEAYGLYIGKLQDRTGVRVNDRLLDQMYGEDENKGGATGE